MKETHYLVSRYVNQDIHAHAYAAQRGDFPDDTRRKRTLPEYGRTIRGFEGWLQTEGKLAGTVETVTRRVVAYWRRDTLIRPSIHHKTANRAISCLSSFWRWLELQGHVQGESPWRGMALPKGKATPNGATSGQPRSAEKRAFTDPELAALLTAEDTSPLLRDGMRCALLTGARIEELFSIRVGGPEDGGPHPLYRPPGLEDRGSRPHDLPPHSTGCTLSYL